MIFLWRTKIKTEYIRNFIKNSSWGIAYIFIGAILTFVTRKLFLDFLGIGLLSVGTLFTSIIGMLSVAELGVSGAVSYICYKPIAEKDKRQLSIIINSYKYINRTIGAVIFTIGLCFVPFLKYIIDIEIDEIYLYQIYILFLLTSVSTYFLAYNNVLLRADQKEYISTKVITLFFVLKSFVQIIVLILTESYLVYLSVDLVSNIALNVVIYKKVNKIYPFLKEKFEVSKREKKLVWKKLKYYIVGMAGVRVAGVVINNTGNIVVSMINTIYVGLIANFNIIVLLIVSIFNKIYASLIPMIGNVKNDKDSNKKLYEIFLNIFNTNSILTRLN